jgi:hypothetical protein
MMYGLNVEEDTLVRLPILLGLCHIYPVGIAREKRYGLFNGAAPKEALNSAGVYQSAVTELSENAVDADATRLEVDIADGGCERMLVRDDGSGMSEEDAKLSVLRHKKQVSRGCIGQLGFEF